MLPRLSKSDYGENLIPANKLFQRKWLSKSRFISGKNEDVMPHPKSCSPAMSEKGR